MTDYGHELLFGSFLTPAAQRPDQVVALAQLSEQAALDLVTFQDHPYQPAFLDTWTLMSYVAAATSRIRLAGNVLNLPLRQPVVLARSVASLDRLTDGRVELGLGAGGFWDAIEASGGRRLTPGQSVEALDEGIRIIREVWSTDRRGGVRVDGDHYRVFGAKRGPAPAHDVGIWVGAYKPRMLRLIGRVADGWLPSLPYLPNGADDLAQMNRHIDDAATAAGRDPRAVRRLLNISGQFTASASGPFTGPVDRWVTDLTELALAYGISGFIVMGDDPSTTERFGQEVAPAVRELVAAARAEAAATPSRAPAPAPATVATTPSASPTPAAGRASGTAPAPAPGDDGFGVAVTPAPSARLTGHRLWDESTRPAGPPAPADYVYTDRARAVGRHLVDVHDHLRGELTQVRDVLQQVEKGIVSAAHARSVLNEMALRQNNWTLGAFCAAYCTVVTQHHGLEDASIFPHLRRMDAGLVPVIDRLEQEHVVIHDVIDGVDRALVAFINDSSDFSRVQDAIDVLTDTLLSHLAYEEQQIVEPIARHGFYTGQV